MKKNHLKIIYLALITLTIIAVVFFLSIWLITYRDYLKDMWGQPGTSNAILKIIKDRSIQLLAMASAAILIASSSLVFQTLTHNKILTPGVLGFDSIYAVIQTILVLILGIIHPILTNDILNFILSFVIMIIVSLLMYSLVLRKNKNNIVLLLLVGMVVTALSSSIANFFQAYMSEDAFYTVKAITSVTVSNVNRSLVFVLLPFVIILWLIIFTNQRTYDVMSLGENTAVNLGINYRRKSKFALIYITFAVALSTALIGPLSFLGLLAVNLARELSKTYKHKHLFVFSSLIAICFIVICQGLVELLGFITTVSVVISLIGGAYMIYLIVRRNAK